jgi:hypothetical protein
VLSSTNKRNSREVTSISQNVSKGITSWYIHFRSLLRFPLTFGGLPFHAFETAYPEKNRAVLVIIHTHPEIHVYINETTTNLCMFIYVYSYNTMISNKFEFMSLALILLFCNFSNGTNKIYIIQKFNPSLCSIILPDTFSSVKSAL